MRFNIANRQFLVRYYGFWKNPANLFLRHTQFVDYIIIVYNAGAYPAVRPSRYYEYTR